MYPSAHVNQEGVEFTASNWKPLADSLAHAMGRIACNKVRISQHKVAFTGFTRNDRRLPS